MRAMAAWAGTMAVLLAAVACGAQTKQWDKRFGGSLEESISAVRPTSDGGFVLGGDSNSEANGDKTQPTWGGMRDYWVVKTDANGTKQWDRRFGGTASDYLNDLLQTSDGGYVLAGVSGFGPSGDRSEPTRGNMDCWIVKIDAAGAKQWDRRYGGADTDDGMKIKATADGGYILATYSTSGASGDRTQDSRGGEDFWVLKLDAAGNKLWDRRFGSPGRDFLEDMLTTPDGGFLLGGSSSGGAGGDKTQDGRGSYDYWVVKVAANGSKQWDRRFGGSSSDNLAGLALAPDGGFLLCGDSDSPADGDKTEAPRGGFDYWVVKIDAAGNKKWDRRFGGNGNEYGGVILACADGGCLLGGYAGSPANGDVSEASRGQMDYWIVKLDPQGHKRWDKRLGGSLQDFLGSMAQTADGGYILGGDSTSGATGERTESSRGDWDYWIVKLAAWPADAYEPDDIIGAARTIANGQAQDHNIHEAGDLDWVKFAVTAPGAVNVRIETAGAAGDTELWVYNGIGGPMVAANDDIGGANKFSRVTIPALAPGTYYARTIAFGNRVVLPAYRLTASWTQNYEPDRYEADNGRSAARRIRSGRIQNRNIHVAGNRDWAKFTISTGGARDVLIETRGTSGDTQIRLYNRRLRRLAADDDSGPGRFSRIRLGALPAGTYYIRVQEKGNDGTIGAYTLKARWTRR